MFFGYTTDILEDQLPVELLDVLLKDRTTGANIFWATSDYECHGVGFEFSDEITPTKVTGVNGRIIMPRVLKKQEAKKKRTREKAEIFTPAWVCNDMCNAEDEMYRAADSHFNQKTHHNGKNDWLASLKPIRFTEGITWEDYVLRTCLEITCGEAPFLVSRYDTSTGKAIPIEQRIGLLDRKIRVVNEQVETIEEWNVWVRKAYKATYGYEWQGDNLLLARENLLYTYIEYYESRWGRKPSIDQQLEIAHIISWNIFQMDGLKMVIPASCKNGVHELSSESLFGDEEVIVRCEGCKKGIANKHNGIPVRIMDWENNIAIEFRTLYGKNR